MDKEKNYSSEKEGIRKISELVMKQGRTILLTQEKLTEGVNPGTIFSDERTGDLSVLLKDQTAYSRFTIGNLIEPLSITGDYIANDSLSGSKLINNSVTGVKISNNSIDQNKLATDAVITAKIRNAAVTTSKIEDGAITESKLASVAIIRETHLHTNSVTTAKIKNDNITRDKLDSSIRTFMDRCVTIDNDVCSINASLAVSKNTTINGTLNVQGKFTAVGDFETKGSFKAARVYHAVYNDLAEAYVPGEEVMAGDIVEIRNDGKIYKAETCTKHSAIVGVVSECYAACYGATQEELESGDKIAVGLIGKVPVKVNGPIQVGDRVFLADGMMGVGCVGEACHGRYYIGKALESNNELGIKQVVCLISPN